MRKQKSSDHLSNWDSKSQTRLQKSPGARSGRSGSRAPSMFIRKSTKKLTMFKEFTFKSTQKELNRSAFVSPFNIKDLESHHDVELINREEKINDKLDGADSHENSIDAIVKQACSVWPPEKQQEVHNKNKALLKDNAAMDAYMRDLCNKYFWGAT